MTVAGVVTNDDAVASVAVNKDVGKPGGWATTVGAWWSRATGGGVAGLLTWRGKSKTGSETEGRGPRT